VLSKEGSGRSIELKMIESPKLNNGFCQTSSEVVIDEKEIIGSLESSTGRNFVEPRVSYGHTFEAVGA